jgi:uncharacterized protein
VKPLLVDAGPLVALHDARDPDHGRCRTVITDRRGVLRTTWPGVAECMYLLSHALPSQRMLLELIRTGRLEVAEISDLMERVGALMARYSNVPMDFTDATLVAVAERDGLSEVFTLDDDFRIYRAGRRALRIVP